jgi:glycosyltransferase involved in cell wall biosynthesis
MFDLALSAVIMKYKFNIPLIITIHTIVQHPNKYYNIILQLIDKSILKYCIIHQADWIICPDKTCFHYSQQTFNIKNSLIILYGIEKPVITDTSISNTIVQTHHLENKQIFLSLGHVHELRNRTDIIIATPEVLKLFPNFILLIVGDVGTEKPRLLLQKLGIEKSVIFTGPVPHTVVPALFNISSIVGQWFHMSNPQTRTLGIAALEAMAAGKIVIGTAEEDVYGKGILIDKTNVILISPQHPEILTKYIIDILRHQYDHIGINASKTIEHYFSWNVICDQTVKLYERALSEKHT